MSYGAERIRSVVCLCVRAVMTLPSANSHQLFSASEVSGVMVQICICLFLFVFCIFLVFLCERTL